jgi:two-component system, cell cycle response regulator DivK
MSILAGKYALIIEDNESSIAVLKHLLHYNGIESTVIRDNSKIELALQEVPQPDIIFLDLEMPHSNGYIVNEYIRQNPKFDNVFVIAYTTHTSHLNDAKTAGFNGFLGKPLDNTLFRRQLEDIFSGIPVWEVP